MQNSTFFLTCLRKNSFESSFYKIDVLMVSNWSVRLEKHQTIELLLKVDFLRIFKNVALLANITLLANIFEIHK